MLTRLLTALVCFSLLTASVVLAQDESPVPPTTDSVSSTAAQQIGNQQSASPEPTATPITTQPVNLTVSPISLNLATDPGATTTSAIKIRNNSNSPEFLQLRLATFTANAAGNAPVIRNFENNEPSQNWLTFSESQFEIRAGEWKTVQLTFSPPKDAALGYYYAILVERQHSVEVEEGSSIVTGVPAILVLTEVSSPLAKRELELVSFSSTKRVYEYLPATFEVVIRNTGNIQTMPMGDIFIDGQRTSDIGIIQLNPAKGMILPNTERTYTVLWQDGFPVYQSEIDQLGNEQKRLRWDFSTADKFRFGQFTATSLFVYDDGQRDIPTEASLTFWVIPWKILIALSIIVVLILLGIFLPTVWLIKRMAKRKKPTKP